MHASYDRAFQTSEFENILLSSSPDVVSLSDQVLRLAVKPSHGNYYELGFTKGVFRRARLDVNYFDRRMDIFAAADQSLDTAVSFSIAFQKSNIYGASKNGPSALGPALRLRELLLHGWLGVSSGDRRNFPGR